MHDLVKRFRMGYYSTMLATLTMPDEIAERLRDAIVASKLSHMEIARQTGIPQPTISRFAEGADMRTSNASKLAAFFKLKLTDDEPPKGKRK